MKKVQQIDCQTGEIINTYDSIAEACRKLNAPPKSGGHISEVCRGKRKTFYSYSWRFVDSEDLNT